MNRIFGPAAALALTLGLLSPGAGVASANVAPEPAPSTAAPNTAAPNTAAPSTPAQSSATPSTAAPTALAPRTEAAASPLLLPASKPVPADPFLAQVLTAANAVRWANGAGPLAWNPAIATGSQQWATKLNGQINAGTLDMNKLHRTDYGASILPKGSDMYTEIIGINNTPQQIVDWWMGSPGHRAALLDKRATDLGMGAVKSTASGWGGMTVVVANLAGYPATRATQPQPPAPPAAPVANAGDVAAVDPSGNLFIYGSARGGDMSRRTPAGTGWAGVQQLEIVDFNADGIMDILAVWKSGALTISHGRAGGTLEAPLAIGSGWAAYDIIATKWRTTDKFPGIVAKQRTTGQLFHYPGKNGSAFSPRTQIGSGWGGLTIIGTDFDGDGRADIAARNPSGQLLLYRGNGSGGFMSETRKVIGTGWGSMTHLSGIANHLDTGAWGILARDGSGNLLHYPILPNRFAARQQVGTGGWGPLVLGS